MNTSMPAWTPRSWSVRIISRPVRSPTWARRFQVCPPNARWRIRPSGVRSNRAPHSSSSRTRAGASCAWSWAIRQWLRNEPPFIVSRKWVSQPSCGSTCASAAAIPPSAITVCAFPRSDLHTSPTRAPRAEASIAARSPAPPAPITSTSCSWVSNEFISSPRRTESARERHDRIVEHAHRAHADVEIGEAHGEQAPPREPHVVLVHPADDTPGLLPRTAGHDAREAVEAPADQMAERVARQAVAAEHRGREEDRQRSAADREVSVGCERADHVPPQDRQEHERDDEEEAVDVLQDQRELGLA